jgi:chorismate dehydratase
VTLVQVLNKHFWKKNIQFIDAKEGFENEIKGTTGAVIIGDRTFGLTKYPYQIDLAEEWTKYTKLPFVFAAWVSNVELPDNFINKFNDALAFGVAHIDAAVLEKPNQIKGFDAVDYLKNKISYDLSEEKKLGLKTFLDLI